MTVIENIILGAIGSIVATIMLFLLSKLYNVGYKKDFNFFLERANNAIYQIENLCTYPDDYNLVIGQIDVLHQCAYGMYKCLSPLALWRKSDSKKLIITLLNDIISICELSKLTTVGFSGDEEREARLDRINRYFYRYKYLENSKCSTIRVELSIIRNLIDKKSIEESIKEAFGNKEKSIPYEDLIVDGFICKNSLKQNNNDIGLRQYCFTEGELEKIFRKR